MTRKLSAALRLLRRHLANTRGHPRDLARLARRSFALLHGGGWREIVERQEIVAELYAEYPQWLARGVAGDAAAIARAARELAASDDAPKISVLMPTRNARVSWLSAAIASVEAQHYGHWQLCIVDDGSPDRAGLELAQARAAADPRIVVQALPAAGGISAATNAAMAMADGAVLSFLDHDDLLAPEALLLVARAFAQNRELAVLYSDEDKIDGNGEHYWPSFKPAWNPDLLLANNYITHLVAVRADLARQVGGMRAEYDGAQDWDFVLRATEAVPSSAIGHLPRILYHWRAVPGSTAAQAANKPYAADAQRRALEAAMQRRGIAGSLQRDAHGWRIRRDVPGTPLVSIVIPVRDRAELLERCLRGVAARAPGIDVEIVVVDNGSTQTDALELLARLADDAGTPRAACPRRVQLREARQRRRPRRARRHRRPAEQRYRPARRGLARGTGRAGIASRSGRRRRGALLSRRRHPARGHRAGRERHQRSFLPRDAARLVGDQRARAVDPGPVRRHRRLHRVSQDGVRRRRRHGRDAGDLAERRRLLPAPA